ncbi:MAG: phosphatase PAP2 family protein [Candidatus Krumholzibacteriota bacterium]|nr:phosphatase PAP2 family protein [Candidatus Krumholzibacteriota bacterium]
MRTATFIMIMLLSLPGLPCAVLADSLSTGPSVAGAVKDTLPEKTHGEPEIEVSLFRALNTAAQNRFFDLVMPVITDFSKWRIVLLVVWAFLVLAGGPKGRWAAFMMIPLIAASDQLCASLIKPAVARARPCQVLGGVHFWHGTAGWITTPLQVTKSYKSSFSFPSNHAANMTAAMLFLGLVYRKWIIPLLLIALAVSYSRVYIGVHWTSDVSAGIAIGALLALAAWKAFRYLGFDSDERRWRWKSLQGKISGH